MPVTIASPVFRWTSSWMRFLAAVLAGVVAYFATRRFEFDLRLLATYDLAAVIYLTLLFIRMTCADSHVTGQLAEAKETSNRLMLAVAALLSGFSLGGVGLMLHRSAIRTPVMANVHLGLSLLAVFLSWTLLHALFGLHYARLHYDRDNAGNLPEWGRGLEFPEGVSPDFWDFMYFAFTISVCYQVSDVTIRSRHIRRVALAHVLLSFLNVTLIIGLVVEIVSALVSPAGRGT